MSVATARPFSPPVVEYLESHAINPRVAARLPTVSEFNRGLAFTVDDGSSRPFLRIRRLGGGQAKVLQPHGRPTALWCPLGRPEFAPTVLLVEGESDALAAVSALAERPVAALPAFAVLALPGTGFPVDRLLEDLHRMETRTVFLAFDGDPAGHRLTRKIGWDLDPAGIRVVPVPIPKGLDLADTLAAVEPGRRGDRFAEMVAEAAAVPPIVRSCGPPAGPLGEAIAAVGRPR